MKTSTILWVAGAGLAAWWLLSMQKPSYTRPTPDSLRARARKSGRITANLAAQRRATKAAVRKRRATT